MRTLLSILLVILVFALSGCYSCQSWNEFWGNGPRGVFPPDKFFFDKDCKALTPPEPGMQK